VAALTGSGMSDRAPGRPALPAPPAAPCTVVVARREDVPRARRAARALAAAQGFGAADAESVALAATELATNLVRYARGGSLTLTPVAGPGGAGGAGVQIESHDAGPGIGDLARAMQDGFSTGGGLGSGLPGLRRLMDEFAVESGAAGTTIVARKWADRAPRGGSPGAPPGETGSGGDPTTSLRVGAASRPYPGESANGDGWAATWDGAACRLTVVDGLGHGPEAAAATRAALDALAARPALAPGDALRACHVALGSTRGAAVSVARIEPTLHRLSFAGVGNVEARLWANGPAGRASRPIAYRGIVGTALPTVRVAEYDLADGWLLILHTDGVSARFELDPAGSGTSPGGGGGIDPQALAETLLARWGRQTDDATAVVATG
jgi:anti-sigma regulatory factor (Ser/Thr protein kinase)